MTQNISTKMPLVATDEERRRILNRLKRLEGQVRGLQTMIDSGKDCDAVLTQVMAAKSALNQVGLMIIGHSMKSCLNAGDASTKDEIVDEALSVLLRYVNLPESWPASDVG
ncbi:MAG TPA: metal-sensitive transcriptional regulator [Coriobacteriia bacterium]|jgi:CsoR family transcriptional regulator, copper-sensing transcriptional repressor